MWSLLLERLDRRKPEVRFGSPALSLSLIKPVDLRS
jgi:hypothetical protein